ncbi:MAG: hypothetical protein KA419_19835 [Acidobacteria bacterium]|nr:hypothetical protein [Acidobacteriota bacterium]
MYGLDLFVMIVFAVFYYRVGVLEYGSGIVWALLSVLLSLLMTNLLDAGVWLLAFSQLSIVLGMTFYNGFRGKPRRL